MFKFRNLALLISFTVLTGFFVPIMHSGDRFTAGESSSALVPTVIPPSLRSVRLDPNVITPDTESVDIFAKIKEIDYPVANLTCTLEVKVSGYTLTATENCTQLDDETWNVTMSLASYDLENGQSLDFTFTMIDTASNEATETIHIIVGTPWDQDPPELSSYVVSPQGITRETKFVTVIVGLTDSSEVSSAILEFCGETKCHKEVAMTVGTTGMWTATVDVTSVLPKISVLTLNITVTDEHNNTETYVIGTYDLGEITVPSFEVLMTIAAVALSTIILERKARK
ncbi:MAG: hypothetical protein ACFFD4_08975 [Candidatus Odinarchaeota archaeon]